MAARENPGRAALPRRNDLPEKWPAEWGVAAATPYRGNGLASVSSFAYTYNLVNNRTSATREDGRTENYGYDAAQQVTTASYGDGTSEGFNDDLMGNLESRTNSGTGVPPVIDTFVTNNLNQYASINGHTQTYDAKGNLLACNLNPSTLNLIYDSQNRLVGASRGTNGAVFVYDGRNRCVQRTINGVTTTFIYDQWNLIAEYQGAAPVAEYLHGPGVDEMLARATALGTFYYTGDALSSTATLTDSGGAVVERYRYTAFGQPSIFDTSSNLLTSSSYGNRFTFQGREWFAELNLTDHRNRYYSPELNRWLNRDPLGGLMNVLSNYPQLANDIIAKFISIPPFEAVVGANLQKFEENNPCNYSDTYGFNCVEVCLFCGAAIQAAREACSTGNPSACIWATVVATLSCAPCIACTLAEEPCKPGHPQPPLTPAPPEIGCSICPVNGPVYPF